MAFSMKLILSMSLVLAAVSAFPLYDEYGNLISQPAHNPNPVVERELTDLHNDLMDNGRQTNGGRVVPDNTQQSGHGGNGGNGGFDCDNGERNTGNRNGNGNTGCNNGNNNSGSGNGE